ncbi:hypothetical protein CEXT_667071 [Caerostris extrusa]|uniref:Uncharacterized protein n=1 Tax=Caerostris extrusa TaxID=172846 RepID=A0AAV4NHF6_CAEEX|nr:hypothetical protein CEXT_667071 [Caerostris extrusa]
MSEDNRGKGGFLVVMWIFVVKMSHMVKPTHIFKITLRDLNSEHEGRKDFECRTIVEEFKKTESGADGNNIKLYKILSDRVHVIKLSRLKQMVYIICMNDSGTQKQIF